LTGFKENKETRSEFKFNSMFSNNQFTKSKTKDDNKMCDTLNKDKDKESDLINKKNNESIAEDENCNIKRK